MIIGAPGESEGRIIKNPGTSPPMNPFRLVMPEMNSGEETELLNGLKRSRIGRLMAIMLWLASLGLIALAGPAWMSCP